MHDKVARFQNPEVEIIGVSGFCLSEDEINAGSILGKKQPARRPVRPFIIGEIII